MGTMIAERFGAGVTEPAGRCCPSGRFEPLEGGGKRLDENGAAAGVCASILAFAKYWLGSRACCCRRCSSCCCWRAGCRPRPPLYRIARSRRYTEVKPVSGVKEHSSASSELDAAQHKAYSGLSSASSHYSVVFSPPRMSVSQRSSTCRASSASVAVSAAHLPSVARGPTRSASCGDASLQLG